MREFEVNDRVVCTRAYERIPVGAVGTVLEVEMGYRPSRGGWIHVYWDDDIGGHTCGHRCPLGHGYRTYGDNLALHITGEELSDFDIGEFLTMVSQ